MSDAAVLSHPSQAKSLSRAVSWANPEVVVSQVASVLDAHDAAALWHDLWFTADDFKAARHQLHLEKLHAPCESRLDQFQARAYSGHKRPALSAPYPVAERNVSPTPSATKCSPSLPKAAAGLCISRGMEFGDGSALAAFCRHRHSMSAASTTSSSVLQAAETAPASAASDGSDRAPLPPPSATLSQPMPSTAPSGICLQRAGALGSPSCCASDNVARMRSQSTAGMPTRQPQRTARNPHGLTMGQRVAALQLGGAAAHLRTTM